MIKSAWKFFKWICSVVVLIAIIAFLFASCDKDDKNTDTIKEETKTESTEAYTFDVQSLIGKTVSEARKAFADSETHGYTYTFLYDGVDLGFDEPTDFDDYYIIESVSGSGKKYDLNIVDKEMNEKEAEQEALNEKLNEKLDEIDALTAVKEYGEQNYSDFKMSLLNQIDGLEQYAKDENTWSIKSKCTVDGVECWLFAEVTGTTANPEVSYFEVHK